MQPQLGQRQVLSNLHSPQTTLQPPQNPMMQAPGTILTPMHVPPVIIIQNQRWVTPAAESQPSQTTQASVNSTYERQAAQNAAKPKADAPSDAGEVSPVVSNSTTLLSTVTSTTTAPQLNASVVVTSSLSTVTAVSSAPTSTTSMKSPLPPTSREKSTAISAAVSTSVSEPGTVSSDPTAVSSSLPSSSSVDKGLPKATVKPNILTHVIETIVKEDDSEPFSGNRPTRGWTAERKRDEENEDGPSRKKMHISHGNATANLQKINSQTISSDHGKGFNCRRSITKTKISCSPHCKRQYNNSLAATGKRNGTSGSSSQDQTNGTTSNRPQDTATRQTTHSDQEIRGAAVSEDSASARKPTLAEVLQWNVNEVCDFIRSIPGCAGYAEKFVMQEVDGEALLLIKPEHLLSTMSIKLGSALKIFCSIEALRPKDGTDEAAILDD